MSVTRRLLLGAGVSTAVLGATELVLRATVPATSLLFEYERPDGLIRLDPKGAVKPREGAVDTRHDGPYAWSSAFNALGLRESSETSPKPPEGKRRVLALGDSWIFGFSVDQAHTLDAELERLLPELEVLNGGVFGSSAYDALRRWEELRDVLEPDALLLGTPHNTGRQREKSAERAEWYRSQAVPTTSDWRLFLALRRVVQPLRGTRYAQPSAPDEEAADVLALVRDARARGLDVYFLAFPVRYETSHAAADWIKLLQPEGVILAGHAMEERSCWGFEDLAHPSEAGARAHAETLARAITSGRSQSQLVAEPRCADVPGAGPGKGATIGSSP